MEEREQNQRKPVTSLLHRKWLWIALLVALLFGGMVGVYGKYIVTQVERAQMHASEFYVSSDYLTLNGMDGTEQRVVPVSGWNEGIFVELYNWERVDGEEKVTQLDVEYSYQVDQISQSKGWSVAPTGNPQTGENGKVTQGLKLTLAPTHQAQKGDRVTLTVTTGPYAANLQATFTLTDAIVPDYTITDMGVYEHVILHSNNYQGNVVIQWDPSKRVPDVTNPLMAGWTPGKGQGTHVISVEPFTTYELFFFEEVSEEYQEMTGTGTSIAVN